MHILSELNGAVFGWDDEGDIPPDHRRLSAKEVDAYINRGPSIEDLSSDERAWRDAELTRADYELNKIADGDSQGSEDQWKEYRSRLRAWPDHEKFPDSGFRPSAPDAE